MLRQNPYLILMGALDFTASDLAFNRRGELSQRQREKLQKYRLTLAKNWGIGLLAISLIGLLVGLPSALLVLELLLIGGLMLMTWLRLSADLAGYVQRASGCARFSPVSPLGAYLIVGDQRFAISRRAYEAFSAGRCYRLYYAPISRTILSAEML